MLALTDKFACHADTNPVLPALSPSRAEQPGDENQDPRPDKRGQQHPRQHKKQQQHSQKCHPGGGGGRKRKAHARFEGENGTYSALNDMHRRT
jgi:hypothetical protein